MTYSSDDGRQQYQSNERNVYLNRQLVVLVEKILDQLLPVITKKLTAKLRNFHELRIG